MTTNARYSFLHNAWSSLASEAVGDKTTLRRLRGGTLEIWRIDAEPGARFRLGGLGSELALHVAEGRFACHVLGNQVELPCGHFAVIPPHVPVEIRLAGRSPGSLLLVSAAPVAPDTEIEPV